MRYYVRTKRTYIRSMNFCEAPPCYTDVLGPREKTSACNGHSTESNKYEYVVVKKQKDVTGVTLEHRSVVKRLIYDMYRVELSQL